MSLSEQHIRAAIADQAGEWFVRLQAAETTAADHRAFFGWLKESPVHVEEYLGVAHVAKGLRSAVAAPDVSLDRFLAALAVHSGVVTPIDAALSGAARREPGRRTPGIWRIAAALAVLALGALWWARDGALLGIPKSYRTAHGEQLTQLLPDGSLLRLDTDSSVTVRYTRRERLVAVESGQAMFDVAHERRGRWFRVAAGDAGVIAVGTRFNIYRQANATVVTVAEGTVTAFTGPPARPASETGQVPDFGEHVRAGYQLRIETGLMTAQPVAVDLRTALGWLQHRIVFEHRPLAEVATEFNRYARTPIEIDDAALGALPISGSFDADDLDSYLAYMRMLPGVRVKRIDSHIRVTSAARGE